MQIAILLAVVVEIANIHCSLISKSVIEQCTSGDPSEPKEKNGQTCAKKFVVSMTLGSGQAHTDSLYANINTAYDLEKAQTSVIKKPYRVEIDKSDVIINYRVYYRGSANAHPAEHVIIFSDTQCSEKWYGRPTCGKYRDKNGKLVFDSQGFCCRCERTKGMLPRANNASCEGNIFEPDRAHVIGLDNRIYDFKSSAHCMNMSDLWYDVFDIESPSLHYAIKVHLLSLETIVDKQGKNPDSIFWKLVSNFTLRNDKTSGRSPDGKVIATIHGDLLSGKGLMDLSAKKLLIPSLRAWHEDFTPPEYKNGASDWLLVDEFLVDLSGEQCNKVGLDFPAFRNQPGKCYQDPNSCFTNQPSMLWAADNERRRFGIKGFYMLHNYGKIHQSTHPNNSSFILRLIYPDLHNSFVTFNLDATDLSFVVNVGKGRIVSAESRGFNRTSHTTGEVVVVVENESDITQDFNLLLTECFGREQLPSKRVLIHPGQTRTVSFPLIARNVKRITTQCEVQLYDQQFTLLGTARLSLSVDAPCFCFGVCDCVCDPKTGKVTEKSCPTPPAIYVDVQSTGTRLALYILEIIGLHGIVGFFGTFLLCLGMMKLMFGGVLFCRKSKAQEHYDNMREKGVPLKSPLLVKCSGHCTGALAAKARMKRKAERMRKLGRDPHRLDDWTNMSFTCYCKSELADIRCMQVIKALCFFYYLLILPCIWLGKKIWWGCFVDTEDKKLKADREVLKAAQHMDPDEMEKLGMVSLPAELRKYQKEDEENRARKEAARKQAAREKRRRERDRKSRQPQGSMVPGGDMEFYNENLWGPENSPSQWAEDLNTEVGMVIPVQADIEKTSIDLEGIGAPIQANFEKLSPDSEEDPTLASVKSIMADVNVTLEKHRHEPVKSSWSAGSSEASLSKSDRKKPKEEEEKKIETAAKTKAKAKSDEPECKSSEDSWAAFFLKRRDATEDVPQHDEIEDPWAVESRYPESGDPEVVRKDEVERKEDTQVEKKEDVQIEMEGAPGGNKKAADDVMTDTDASIKSEPIKEATAILQKSKSELLKSLTQLVVKVDKDDERQIKEIRRTSSCCTLGSPLSLNLDTKKGEERIASSGEEGDRVGQTHESGSQKPPLQLDRPPGSKHQRTPSSRPGPSTSSPDSRQRKREREPSDRPGPSTSRGKMPARGDSEKSKLRSAPLKSRRLKEDEPSISVLTTFPPKEKPPETKKRGLIERLLGDSRKKGDADEDKLKLHAAGRQDHEMSKRRGAVLGGPRRGPGTQPKREGEVPRLQSEKELKLRPGDRQRRGSVPTGAQGDKPGERASGEPRKQKPFRRGAVQLGERPGERILKERARRFLDQQRRLGLPSGEDQQRRERGPASRPPTDDRHREEHSERPPGNQQSPSAESRSPGDRRHQPTTSRHHDQPPSSPSSPLRPSPPQQQRQQQTRSTTDVKSQQQTQDSKRK